MRKRILPGFGLSLGVTVAYLGFLLVLPVSALIIKASGISLEDLWIVITSDEAVSSYVVTFRTTVAASLLNAGFGTLLAWILVRYDFPTKKLWDTIIDLPFALPGAVGGIALATVFAASGWVGGFFEPWGIKLAYSEIGIVIAIVFSGIPFVVRSVQPVLEGLDPAHEEAASVLGATEFKTFWRVVFPAIFPAVLTGFTMAFARGIGEFGTVIFISSNIPLQTQVVSRYISNLLEQYDIQGATAVGVVTLAASFLLLLTLNLAQSWQRRNERRA